ncbi:MAG: class II fumarate hydratase [Cellvibrionaceae bacterium]
MDTRLEKDSSGEIPVSNEALWGAQTQRSLENFRIGRQRFSQEFILAYAQIKKSSALANEQLGKLQTSHAKLIVTACDEIIAGEHNKQFPLVVWQTGSGTQTNMNLNEVIANRANELDGKLRGSMSPIHPNDHVNLSQSSNDSFPTAMHVTTAQAVSFGLLPIVSSLIEELDKKEKDFQDTMKTARTHMMDATPITLGQEFSGYIAQLNFTKKQIEHNLSLLYPLALGGSAVGTGLNTHLQWAETVAEKIATETGLPFSTADNKFMELASHDALINMHASLKLLATNLFKIASDLRLMASGPRCGLNEINLPENEPGSSIMPGKINPTQIEALTMVALQVMGNDVTVSMANSQGQFELNVYKPVIIHNVLESVALLSDAISSFTDNCIVGISANQAQLKSNVSRTLMLVTALTPHIGYDNAAHAAKYAYENGTTLKHAVTHLKLMKEKDFDIFINPEDMIRPN